MAVNAYGAVRESLRLLAKDKQMKFVVLILFQFFTSILDLAAVTSMGALTIAATSNNSGTKNQGLIYDYVRILENYFASQSQLLVTLSTIAISLFMIKSVVSLYFSRRALQFLSKRYIEITSDLFGKFMNNSLAFVQMRSSQEAVASINDGVGSATLAILGSASVLCSEIGLLTILAIGLFFIDPILTFFTILYFGLVIYWLNRLLSGIGVRAGRLRALSNIHAASLIQETIGSFRELYVADRLNFTSTMFSGIQSKSSKSIADAQWVALVPKYAIEFSLILGTGLLAGYQFVNNDPVAAVGSLTVFLAAGSRILPSILRIQGAISMLQGSIGSAEYSFHLIKEIENEKESNTIDLLAVQADSSIIFEGSISLNSVSFSYPRNIEPALSGINLEIPAGSSLAIVGSTGAGKSTLADLLLGLHQPQVGQITLCGVNPQLAMKLWPGKVGYVPQAVSLFNTSVRKNIAIARDDVEIDDEKIWSALEKSRLADFVRNNPSNLDMQVGERGVKLSGGQKQRLGLARALYGEPELLILDEATSALDAETENAISLALKQLANKVTIITIAHRLATIRNADKVIYLENGRIIATGNFREVREAVPEFDNQANLLGL